MFGFGSDIESVNGGHGTGRGATGWTLPWGRAAWIACALSLALANVASLGPRAAAAAPGVSPDVRAKLLLKVLSYDRQLAQRSGGHLVLAVVTDPAAPAAVRKDTARMVDALRAAAERFKVAKMRATVVAVELGPDLAATLAAQGATAVYAVPSTAQAPVVAAAALARHAPTLTTGREAVVAGMAVGIFDKGGRPGILINLPVAKALGMKLDAKLLRFAELLR